MKFGEWLRKSRENRGFSRPALAKRIDVHPNTVRNYEEGINTPDDDTLELIAEVFGEEFRSLWAMANEKAHKRVIELLSKVEKQDFEPKGLSDPEVKEILDILGRHPHLKRVALGALRPLDTKKGDTTDRG